MGLTLLSLIIIAILILLCGSIRRVRFLQNSSLYSLLKKLTAALERRWPLLYILIGLLLSAILLTLFAELAWKTLFRHQLDGFDNRVIWFIRYYANNHLDSVMIQITSLGSAPFYGVLAVLTLAGLSLYRRWLETAALAVCLAGGGLLNFLLKDLFERNRPDMFRVIDETGYSFPSGHAMVSLCFYGMLAYLISRHIPRWRWRFLLFILTAIFVVAIGISRIYLGVHYPTDVLAGYAAGSTWLFFCLSLLMWWEQKRKR
ncbi:MAG: phosphatase PAP2 family protein [Veillonellales bacterium]